MGYIRIGLASWLVAWCMAWFVNGQGGWREAFLESLRLPWQGKYLFYDTRFDDAGDDES